MTMNAKSAATPEAMRNLVSIKDAAVLLRVSESTIWRWIKDGTLPSHRVGPKRVFVSQRDISEMIRPQRPANIPEEVWNRLNVVHISTPPPGVDPFARAWARLQEHIKEHGPLTGPEAWEDINDARDERSREIDERADANQAR
jgi:excisionase family DNA binding protein